MVPNKVYIKGFKRFEDTSVLLDRKLLAFVGANEAGKSSFFEALLSIETISPYSISQLTKGLKLENKPEHVVVEVEYLLEKQDLQKVKEYFGIGSPKYYYLGKKVNGTQVHGFRDGSVEKNLHKKTELLKIIANIIKSKSYDKFLDKNYYLEEEDSEYDGSQSLRSLLEVFKEELLENNLEEAGQELQSFIGNKLKYENKYIRFKKEKINELISSLSSILNEDEPQDRFLEYCDQTRPKFVLFEETDRLLKGTYTLQDLTKPTNALLNLLAVAEMDLSDYKLSVKNKDDDKRKSLNKEADENLKKKYSSWSQSKTYPTLLLDKDSLSIKIELPSKGFIGIEYRSDGFKQYIALKAFLHTNSHDLPVLLIDEAEIHLHYAAQADLIKEFEKQDYVNSIIYTTHSAGCLPSDLGSGIRAVEQIFEMNTDSGFSKIRNSIWRNNAGFSPILLAMGANIISFTLARKALFAEGVSETILLPRLLREATGLESIEFQVAPGIAEISKKKLKELKLEAAINSYLVDGDKGGEINKKTLIGSGINENSIIILDKDCTLEDYVSPKVLLDAINRELNKIQGGILEIDIDEIPYSNRVNYFKTNCKKNNFDYPSKARIAENIATHNSNVIVIDLIKKESLKKKYSEICEVLDVDKNQ
ncbi:MAG: putative ATP-dependent endonuclease of OLD family [Flavobacteriaceae bacterium]|jgi:predicted ATP-dependent endonuclease of OLD family